MARFRAILMPNAADRTVAETHIGSLPKQMMERARHDGVLDSRGRVRQKGERISSC